MNCPNCGYALTPFDKECPRCKNFTAKGIRPAPAPAPPPTVTPAPTQGPPSPLPGSMPSVYPMPPKPRMIWKTWEKALLAGVFIVISAGVAVQVAVTSAQDREAQQRHIIDAARQGSCDKLNRAVAGSGCTFTDRMLDKCGVSVTMITDTDAEVTFRLNGGVYDEIEVERDTDGAWNAR